MDALLLLVGLALSGLRPIFGFDVCPGPWAWTTSAAGALFGLLPTAGAVAVARLRLRRGARYPSSGLTVPLIALVSCGLLPWLMFQATGQVLRAARFGAIGLTAADLRSLSQASCLGTSQRTYLGSTTVAEALSDGPVRAALFGVPLVGFPLVAAFLVWLQARAALRRGPRWPCRFFWLPVLVVALLTGSMPAGSTAQLWLGMLGGTFAGVFAVLLVPPPRLASRWSTVRPTPSSPGRPVQRADHSSARRAQAPSAASGGQSGSGRGPVLGPWPARPDPARAPAAQPAQRMISGRRASGAAAYPGTAGKPRGLPTHARGSTPDPRQSAEQAFAAMLGAAPAALEAARAWGAKALAQAGFATPGGWRDWLLGPPARTAAPSPPGRPSPTRRETGARAPLAADPGPLPGGDPAVPRPRPPATLVRAPSSLWGGCRFELIRQLGAGGFGGVWLATDHRLGQPVAVKAALVPDQETEQRIRREARALGAVAHPNCVRILDLVDSRSDAGLAGLRGLVIVMEYVEGQSLGERVVSQGPVDDVTAARIWLRAAGALHAAHLRGVLHRDVKPSNVVLDPRGEPHLIDFGIARTPGDVTLTMHGMVIGTPDFLAPETARGERATPSSDAWQLAATISFALTGVPPRGDRSDAVSALLAAAAGAPPTHLPHRGAHRRLLAACLASDPAARPGLEQLRAVLEQWLAGQAVSGGDGGMLSGEMLSAAWGRWRR